MKCKDIADYIQQKLLEQDFIVHRYEAYSTNSIYLKLDYGAMNSIRISDHNGKEHLSYKYNVIKGSFSSYWNKDSRGFWRYFCQPNLNSINNMLEMIITNKLEKKTLYNYDKLIQQYKEEIKNAKGFWQQAKEMKL